jgi:hypothetical protein
MSSLIDTFSQFESPFSYDGMTHKVYWKRAGEPSERSPAVLPRISHKREKIIDVSKIWDSLIDTSSI